MLSVKRNGNNREINVKLLK